MTQKVYKSISEVSKLLNINQHVIRYWDSKFDGISTRINNNKQRFFNNENIKKITELKSILYKNGKHNYSLDLANKLINKNRTKSSLKNENISSNPINDHQIEKLKEIRENLKNLLKL